MKTDALGVISISICALSYICAVPILVLFWCRFRRLGHEMHFLKRKPNCVRLGVGLAIVHLCVVQPISVVIRILGLMSDLIHLDDILFTATVLGLTYIFLMRNWLFYYEVGYYHASKAMVWKQQLNKNYEMVDNKNNNNTNNSDNNNNNDSNNDNNNIYFSIELANKTQLIDNTWFILHKKTYGNAIYAAYFFSFCYIISIAVLIAIATSAFPWYLFIAQCVLFLLPIIALVYLWKWISPITDFWKIRDELLMCSIGMSICMLLYLSLHVNIIMINNRALSLFFIICIGIGIMIVITISTARVYHLWRNEQQNTARVSQNSTEFEKMDLRMIIKDRHGYELFMEHLLNELSLENLLFLSELMQYKTWIRKRHPHIDNMGTYGPQPSLQFLQGDASDDDEMLDGASQPQEKTLAVENSIELKGSSNEATEPKEKISNPSNIQLHVRATTFLSLPSSEEKKSTEIDKSNTSESETVPKSLPNANSSEPKKRLKTKKHHKMAFSLNDCDMRLAVGDVFAIGARHGTVSGIRNNGNDIIELPPDIPQSQIIGNCENNTAKCAFELYQKYIGPHAPNQINISGRTRRELIEHFEKYISDGTNDKSSKNESFGLFSNGKSSQLQSKSFSPSRHIVADESKDLTVDIKTMEESSIKAVFAPSTPANEWQLYGIFDHAKDDIMQLLRDSFRRFTVTAQYTNLCRERAKQKRNIQRSHRRDISVASLRDMLRRASSIGFRNSDIKPIPTTETPQIGPIQNNVANDNQALSPRSTSTQSSVEERTEIVI